MIKIKIQSNFNWLPCIRCKLIKKVALDSYLISILMEIFNFFLLLPNIGIGIITLISYLQVINKLRTCFLSKNY